MPHRMPRAPHALLTSLSVVLSLGLTACAGSGAEATEPEAADTAGGSSAHRDLPAGFNPRQGETAYGVYIAIVNDGDPAVVQDLMAELQERGVTTAGSGQLGCDQGAAAALGLDEEATAVSVAFRTRADAERFATEWGTPVVGVAEFVAYCRD